MTYLGNKGWRDAQVSGKNFRDEFMKNIKNHAIIVLPVDEYSSIPLIYDTNAFLLMITRMWGRCLHQYFLRMHS